MFISNHDATSNLRQRCLPCKEVSLCIDIASSRVISLPPTDLIPLSMLPPHLQEVINRVNYFSLEIIFLKRIPFYVQITHQDEPWISDQLHFLCHVLGMSCHDATFRSGRFNCHGYSIYMKLHGFSASAFLGVSVIHTCI